MSKINIVLSGNHSPQWKQYKNHCIIAAVMSAELPINKADPFHYDRLVSCFKLGYEEFHNFIREAVNHAKQLGEVNFRAYRERVSNKLGFTPQQLQELYR